MYDNKNENSVIGRLDNEKKKKQRAELGTQDCRDCLWAKVRTGPEVYCSKGLFVKWGYPARYDFSQFIRYPKPAAKKCWNFETMEDPQ